jgi:glutaredoxin
MIYCHDIIDGIRFWAVLAVLVIFSALPARADLYSWTDANGVKHFSNEAPQNGQEAERRAEIKHSDDQYRQWDEQRQSRQDEALEESRSNDAPSQNKALPDRPGKVVMYGTPTCKYCAKARAFFQEHGIAYKEYDITNDKGARDRFNELHGTGVPLIFVGEKRVSGFREALLKQLLAIE